MELNCEHCIDHQKSIFNNLSREEKQILQENYQCRFYGKGDIIFREGDRPMGLLSLASGMVKVFKTGVGGREQIVRMAKPVGFIGYRALFAEENHTTTAVALEDSKVCIFQKDSLLKVMQCNFNVSFGILKAFATELGFTINRTVTLTQKHIRGRLAESLIFLKDTYGYEADNQTIKVYLTREDIANLSCMTSSNAIRTLSIFAGEGVIKLDGKRIKILSENKLEKISTLG
ncbi:MAG: cyclic nucleotide-binding domain-containing protein [Bacteroidetes bacterium]|jgi:CRP-like cAMP-binding protein|nr:cyclic nucleotide-binding domain-containing protein [Bacteroidota bacterium]